MHEQMLDNVPITDMRLKYIILDAMRRFKRLLNKHSKVKWRISSFVRPSPNHQHGWSFDLAMRQPVKINSRGQPTIKALNRNRPLMLKLVALKDAFNRDHHPLILYVFVETDHLHCQFILSNKPLRIEPGQVYAWPYASKLYPNETNLEGSAL